jgi:hypothetical protein
MSPTDAVILLNDPDWVVRYTAVQRVEPEALTGLVNDPEPDVREAVLKRIANQASGSKSYAKKES